MTSIRLQLKYVISQSRTYINLPSLDGLQKYFHTILIQLYILEISIATTSPGNTNKMMTMERTWFDGQKLITITLYLTPKIMAHSDQLPGEEITTQTYVLYQ
uniref:Uncharacterized protein n=1 Tax=Cacopsylla melanoneura TaxID=428564 RepID=A0A8D8W4B6_9HEMI